MNINDARDWLKYCTWSDLDVFINRNFDDIKIPDMYSILANPQLESHNNTIFIFFYFKEELGYHGYRGVFFSKV